MSKKIKIIFVCLGNICRSPAAEGVFAHLLKKKNLENQFEIDSAGTSGYHHNALPDARMRAAAQKRNIALTTRSRKFLKEDLEKFDFIIVMDRKNQRDVLALDTDKKHSHKVLFMTQFVSRYHSFAQQSQTPDPDHDRNSIDVLDPYYESDYAFDFVLDLLEDACEGLIQFILISKHSSEK